MSPKRITLKQGSTQDLPHHSFNILGKAHFSQLPAAVIRSARRTAVSGGSSGPANLAPKRQNPMSCLTCQCCLRTFLRLAGTWRQPLSVSILFKGNIMASPTMTTVARIQYVPLCVPGSMVAFLQRALERDTKHDTARVRRIATFIKPACGLFVPHSCCSLF